MTITQKEPAQSAPFATVASLTAWIPILLLPAAVYLTAKGGIPRWQLMWALTAAIFAGVKWSSWWNGPRLTPSRATAYLLLWPGMDPQPFALTARHPALPHRAEWLWAIAKTLFGVSLIWLDSPHLPPLARAWTGMIGIVFVLHFGLFHLLALSYRAAGLPVEPLMRNPSAAASLGDFWGARWNRGFRDWAHRQLFRPVEQKLGPMVALWWVFLVSGLLHEVAISVPAGGGYGGPTAYFLFQGGGTLLERSRWAQGAGLRGHPWRGRLVTLTVVIAPLGLLFHPPFAIRVILPFLQTIGAH